MKATTTRAHIAQSKANSLIAYLTEYSVTVRQLASIIFDNANSGSELIVNESLFFGMGVYTYAYDLKHCIDAVYVPGLNPLYSHLELSVNNIAHYLDYIYLECGYLEISGTPIYLDIAA